MPEKMNVFNMIHSKMDQAENIVKVRLEDTCFAGADFAVTRSLDMSSAIGFVRAIADDCVNYDDASFTPEVFDFSVRFHMIEFYTELEPSDDMNVMYDVLYQTSMFATVFDVINQDQFRTLVAQAQDRIAHERKMIISTAAQQVKGLIEKIAVFADGTEKITNLVSSNEFSDYMNMLIPTQKQAKKRTPRKKKALAPSSTEPEIIPVKEDNVISMEEARAMKDERDG